MKILVTLLLALVTFAVPAYADQKKWDLSDFAELPVLHEGRVKPVDSFARIHLRQIYGAEQIGGISAVQWLAGVLFDPTAESTRPVIRIRDTDVKMKLGLDKGQTYFSVVDLAPAIMETQDDVAALIQAEEELTPVEQKFLAVHENVTAMNYLLGSFSLILPITATVPESYGVTADEAQTYEALAALLPRLQDDVKRIVRRKGQDVSKYTTREREIALLSFQLDQLSASARGNALFKVFALEDGEWASPWQLITQGHGSPERGAVMDHWERAAQGWRAQDEAQWEESVTRLQEAVQVSRFRLTLEKFYNILSPFNLAMGLFGLSLLFAVTSELSARGLTRLKPARFWPFVTAAMGVGVMALGLMMRIIVLDRPPVSTLYESVLFVTLVTGVLGLVFAYISKQKIATVATALACVGLLCVAPVLISGSDDMEVLPAVLNSSFWLGTHVVMVTAGYGACVIAAVLAHGWLAFESMAERETAKQASLMRAIYAMSGLALLLTLVGTVLGGIWADQSWGRFWGWDPKENGALLIVLWLIWAQHGRLSKDLNAVTFAVSMAALNIIVALAWFGVNLLNVGLHSYGFTSGLAAGLGIFCTLQIIVIAMLWFVNTRNKERVS